VPLVYFCAVCFLSLSLSLSLHTPTKQTDPSDMEMKSISWIRYLYTPMVPRKMQHPETRYLPGGPFSDEEAEEQAAEVVRYPLTNYYSVDEVWKVDKNPNNLDIEYELIDAGVKLIIAQMLPPRYVGHTWRKTMGNSLSHNAYSLVSQNYNQFASFHKLVEEQFNAEDGVGVDRRDRVSGWRALAMGRMFKAYNEDVWSKDATTLSERRTVDTGAAAHFTIEVCMFMMILASIGLIGIGVPGMTCVKLNESQTTPMEREMAYQWMSDNWIRVRKLLSLGRRRPRCCPSANQPIEWWGYLVDLLEKQLGLMLLPTPGGGNGHYTLQPCVSSMWRQLGVDMASYLVWLQGVGPTQHSMSHIVLGKCVDCAAVGSPGRVPCVVQCGQLRCLAILDPVGKSHRSMTVPLDVGTWKGLKVCEGRRWDGLRVFQQC
jgi:hypothetical protein